MNDSPVTRYQDGMPSWMTASELMAAGYNVDPHYKPYISSEELHDTVQESVQQFYIRNFFITQCALQATEEPGGKWSGVVISNSCQNTPNVLTLLCLGNVLLVGHAATLDTCSRQLVGKETRGVNEMMGIVRSVISYVYDNIVSHTIDDALMRCQGSSSQPLISWIVSISMVGWKTWATCYLLMQ